MKKTECFLKQNWLLCLICVQPFLDVLAFWTRSEAGTAAGYIRLAIMAVLGLYCVFHIKNYRRFVPAAVLVVLVFGLHMLNCCRKGYLGFVTDTKMIVSIASLPVLAVCFSCFTEDNRTQSQIVKGLQINFFIETAVVLVSVLTGTYMHTYSEGFGISGWVISDNRCCHSDILASTAIFAAYYSVVSKKKWVNVFVPVIITIMMLINGTTVCYMTLLAVTICFPVFLLIRSLILKKKFDLSQKIVSVVMSTLFVISILVYPVTPRYKMEELKNSKLDLKETQFAAEMDQLGYNVYAVTLDDIFSDELLHSKFIDYYKLFVYSNVDPLGRQFSFDRIIEAYDGTVNSSVLGDARDMKNVYVRFLFEDSDFLTRMFGIEYDRIGPDKGNDLENDWFAVLYYLGYFGFASAVCAVIYIFYRIFRLIRRRFKESLTDLNFTLLLGFTMQLGMAYFSGAIMRRPNASIYIALFAALLVYRTSDKEGLLHESQCYNPNI